MLYESVWSWSSKAANVVGKANIAGTDGSQPAQGTIHLSENIDLHFHLSRTVSLLYFVDLQFKYEGFS